MVDTVDTQVNDNMPMAETAAAEPVHSLVTLTAIWTVARPVVLFVDGLLFWKPKWQKALALLVTAMDAVAQQPADMLPAQVVLRPTMAAQSTLVESADSEKPASMQPDESHSADGE